MINEKRNQLLLIRTIYKKGEQDKQFNFEWLLDSYENELKNEEKEINYKLAKINETKELIEIIRKEIKK